MRALIGLRSTRLRPKEREHLARHAIPGVLLLRHNVIGAEPLRELCEAVHDIVRRTRGHDAIVAVDEEGGAVSPLAPAIGESSSSAACGWVDDVEFTRRLHAERARKARELGIRLILAPVADVHRRGNPVIATRAFASESDTVGRHVLPALQGLREGGVRNCVKHWPGHGAVRVDSHYELPRLTVDVSQWQQVDLPPFERALTGSEADAVMIAHLCAPFLAGDERATTVSRKVVHEWLRERMRFEGAILSDALEMGAFDAARPREALAAGCDLLLLATPIEGLRTEVLDELAAVPADPQAEDRIRALASPPDWPSSPLSFAADFDPRCLRSSGPPWAAQPRRWVLVDAASSDRLLRPPEGIESLRSEDPRVSVSLLGSEFEAAFGSPAAELRLSGTDEAPGDWVEGIEPDLCVVASVRPPGPALRRWLEGWTERQRGCCLVLLGAVALDVEWPSAARSPERSVLRCPELHRQARQAVIRAVSGSGAS